MFAFVGAQGVGLVGVGEIAHVLVEVCGVEALYGAVTGGQGWLALVGGGADLGSLDGAVGEAAEADGLGWEDPLLVGRDVVDGLVEDGLAGLAGRGCGGVSRKLDVGRVRSGKRCVLEVRVVGTLRMGRTDVACEGERGPERPTKQNTEMAKRICMP